MKTKFLTVLLPIVLLVYLPLLSVAQSAQKQEQTFTPEHLREDFTRFRSALEEAHPGLYRYTPKAVFDAKFDSTFATLSNPKSEQEFYVALKPLVTLIRCGHTKFLPKGEYNYWFHAGQLFPLKLYITGSKAHILYSYDGAAEAPAGAELRAINGKPFGDILQKLLPNVSFADGLVQSSKYIELSKYFSGYYASFIEATPVYSVTYSGADGKEVTAEYPAIRLETLKASEQQKEEAKPKQSPFSLTFNEENVAVLNVDWFMNSEEAKFKKFMAEAFKTIKERNPKALVIDLRYNEGGMDSYGMLLSSYLADKPFQYFKKVVSKSNKKFSFSDRAHEPWYYGYFRSRMRKNDEGTYDVQPRKYLKEIQPARDAFTGDVYVLTNGWSFSVTGEFASVVHHMGRATFVGQETGGAYQGDNSGYFSILPLPNTNIDLGIPLWAYYTAIAKEPVKDRGIIPHHIVEPTVQDVLTGTDRELLYTLELIRKKAASQANSK
ncbi:S41 family peptidase [Pontibacter saemangeumensis]|uniref:S41 family peptidase n=1 Tax=Pontibacter saemangeumensis TaxID=1084525 RepID=A0ABP8LYY0_9BACT